MLSFGNTPVFKMMCLWFMLFAALFRNYSATRRCNLVYELQCDDGSCISKIQWCDSTIDCNDGSDEKYCNGKTPCDSAIHFECDTKKCVPIMAVCDGYDDCFDNSDEKNCSGSSLLKEPILMDDVAAAALQNFQRSFNNANQSALDKAVQYLLNQMNSDGWGAFTPRAIVALSMASRESPIAEKSKQLMLKHLNIRILQDLMRSENATLSSLAFYINALHATCQDPRNFQGIDLVARLRSETDVAMKSNASIPLAFLTLCLSDAVKAEDKYHLADLYNSKSFALRTGSRSLIMLAMTCIMNKYYPGVFREYASNFFSDLNEVQVMDIYTKTLFMQASIAAGSPRSIEIASQQLPDGSFGDILSTYYAIPVLMNSSLLDLVCNSQSKGTALEFSPELTKRRNEIIYSLWIPSGKDVISHTINVEFHGKKSLFYIMTMAAAKDPLYKFLFDKLDPEGIRVYSVAGIPNDVESGTSWQLYVADGDNVKVNSVDGLTFLDIGVDQYFPDDQDHIIVWLKRSLRTN